MWVEVAAYSIPGRTRTPAVRSFAMLSPPNVTVKLYNPAIVGVYVIWYSPVAALSAYVESRLLMKGYTAAVTPTAFVTCMRGRAWPDGLVNVIVDIAELFSPHTRPSEDVLLTITV